MEEKKTTREDLRAALDRLLEEDWVADANLPGTEETQPQREMPTKDPKTETKESGSDDPGILIFLREVSAVLAVITLAFVFLARYVVVDGSSMYPTLVHGDRILLLSNAWISDPEKGDVVVVQVPEFSEKPIVKRVIGTAGDKIDIDFDNGIVYVNGQPLSEPYINELTYKQYENGVEFPLTVEEGKLFLLGDNRNHSIDSRYADVGLVDVRCVLGRVVMVIFPGKAPENDSRDFSRIGAVG